MFLPSVYHAKWDKSVSFPTCSIACTWLFCRLRLPPLRPNESTRRESEFPQLCDKSSPHLVFMKNKWCSAMLAPRGVPQLLEELWMFKEPLGQGNNLQFNRLKHMVISSHLTIWLCNKNEITTNLTFTMVNSRVTDFPNNEGKSFQSRN